MMEMISACSFVIEPWHLWRRRIVRRYYQIAPLIKKGDDQAAFSCTSESISIPLSAIPWRDHPLTSSDQAQRVRDAIALGIKAEVVFPTFAWSLFGLSDPYFEAACLAAYNTWFISPARSAMLRLFGAALIPSGTAGLTELARCATLNFRAAVISAASEEQLPRELLEAAARLDMPTVLVRRGGATPLSDFRRFTWESAGLATAAARSGCRVPPLVVLCNEAVEMVPDAAVNYVFPWGTPIEGDRRRILHGHLGHAGLRRSPDNPAADRENAIRLFQLPDTPTPRYESARAAARLAARDAHNSASV
jgi:hypothetical protein